MLNWCTNGHADAIAEPRASGVPSFLLFFKFDMHAQRYLDFYMTPHISPDEDSSVSVSIRTDFSSPIHLPPTIPPLPPLPQSPLFLPCPPPPPTALWMSGIPRTFI